jgi:hypothetical protein
MRWRTLIPIILLLTACKASPAAAPVTELSLLDADGQAHPGLLAGGCRIEIDSPDLNSGQFIPFESGQPFIFLVPDGVDTLTLEMLPFDEGSAQPGEPIHSQRVPDPASQISFALNAAPGWYILSVTLELPDSDCYTYWFPVGVTD